MSVNRFICILLGMFVLSAGGLLPADAAPKGGKKPAEVPFFVLLDGQSSWIDTQHQQAVRDQDAWETLWSMHADSPTCGFTSPPPTVDFNTDMVVAVFLGTRGNTAYTVRIDKITVTENGYLVNWVEEENRAKNVVFSEILTEPFVFAVCPRTDGVVTFEGTKVIVKRRK